MARATGHRAADFYSDPELLRIMTVREDRALLTALLTSARYVHQPLKLRWIHKNGSMMAVELRAQQVLNEDGHVVALDVYAREIVDTRRMEGHVNDADARLLAALDLAEDGIGTLTCRRADDGKVIDFVWNYANRSAIRLLGVDADELIGSTATATFSESPRGDLLRYFCDARETQDSQSAPIRPFALGNGLLMSASRFNDGVVIRLHRSGDRAVSTVPPIAVWLPDDALDSRLSSIHDQLRGVADALLSIGADFAVIVVAGDKPEERFLVIRTIPQFARRPALEKTVDRWMRSGTRQSTTESESFSGKRAEVQASSGEQSVPWVRPAMASLDLSNVIPLSSLHAIPITDAAGEIGVIWFGTAEEHDPLTPEQVRQAHHLTAKATYAIEIDELRAEKQLTARMREQFMSTVAHEIRTPLTGIRGYTQLLNRYLAGDEPDIVRARKAANGLRTQIDRFLTLADDLLDAARIHHGRLDLRLERTDLRTIARDAVERINTMIDQTGRVVDFDVDRSLPGVWDAARIDQVLFILLSNAIQYSRDGEVRLAAWQVDDRTFVAVTDHGIGIAPGEVEALFEPFVRGQSAETMAQGSGLGLYLARKIVQQHGGQITIRSQPQVGTTITVQLPAHIVGSDAAE